MVSFLLAGHETSASFLSFAIYILATNKKLQDKIYNELNTSNSAAVDAKESSSGLSQSETLTNVMREALRIYPPAPMIGRVALRVALLIF